jgi:transposase
MTDELTVTTERVDDIPVLIAHMQRMNMVDLMDAHFPTHGNWQGLSLGAVSVGWLSHILSQADHRLNHVQPWAGKRLDTLRACLGMEVQALDFSDDRLARVLDALSQDVRWAQLEAALNQRTIRVYDLNPERVRLDSTTASGYWTVTEDGLFQFGHSQLHRSDQPQVKVMLSVLDPLGLPLATQVVSGNKADDPLYIPAIQQVHTSLGKAGLLYVGDCKMMALSTRAFVQGSGAFYLGPFSKVQVSDETLACYLQPVWCGAQALTPVDRIQADGQPERIAEGYEREEQVSAVVGEERLTWTERRLVIRSLAQARAAQAALHARLARAEAALHALNTPKRGKRRLRDVASLRQAAEAIVQEQGVADWLHLEYEERVQERRVRGYKQRPAERRMERSVQVRVRREEAAIQQASARLGWRVYGTNQSGAQLSLAQAVLAYREEYLVERGFGRFKGQPLSLTPMYLQDDRRATGLVRLLSLGLRVLTVLEFGVRRRLAAGKDKLAGLYAGNPKRATARPTAETLLAAFKEITLSVVTLGQHVHRHLTPLSELQQHILTLLDLPVDTYSKLAAHSSNPP